MRGPGIGPTLDELGAGEECHLDVQRHAAAIMAGDHTIDPKAGPRLQVYDIGAQQLTCCQTHRIVRNAIGWLRFQFRKPIPIQKARKSKQARGP